MKKAWISCSLAVLIAAGCTAQPPKVNAPSPEDQDRYAEINSTVKNEEISDPYDGNNITRYNNVGLKNFDIGHDQDMIRSFVADTEGFDPGLITINGKDAWVFAKMSSDVSKEQRKGRVNELQTAIERMMPRYDIHLNINVARS